MTDSYDIYNQGTIQGEEYRKKLLPLMSLLQGAFIMRKHGSDMEMISFPRVMEPDIKERLREIETKNFEMEREIKHLKKQLEDSNEDIKQLKTGFEEVVERKVDEMLEDVGFSPITSAVLKEYKGEDVEKCKLYIIQEIKSTNGHTDASDIASKYGIPFRLVAGCFDLLLSEGKIGQTE